jgi:hypothetical protein
MNDVKKIPPLARGNVWTGMPAFAWSADKMECACARSAGRRRPGMGALRPGLRPQPRAVRVEEFLAGRTPKHFAIIHSTTAPELKPHAPRDGHRSCFATLVLRHAFLRVLLHAIAAMCRPRKLRWHLQGITRELLYGCLWKK